MLVPPVTKLHQQRTDNTTMQYNEDLNTIQHELINMLTADHLDTPEITNRILKFQQLLACSKLLVEKSHRDLNLSHSNITALEYNATSIPRDLVQQLSQLLQWENFLIDYKRRLDETIIQQHSDALEKRKHTRAAAVEVAATAAAPHPSTSCSSPSQTATSSLSVRDRLLNTNKAITSNLIRSNHVLQSSVLQSSLNLDELSQQTTSLSQLNSKFDQLNLLLGRSATMVKTIESSSGREKQQIYIALSFLGACIAWVIWRRLLRAPLRLSIWLWFRFFRAILVTTGLAPTISDVSFTASSTALAAATTTAATAAVPETILLATLLSISSSSAVERAVDEAFTRIVDEL
ncbi:Sec20p Ecym_3595 [Eremothecium cymbalariae DBVPG|uniref:Sec20 C-terminal domain-containing protein n=1 Tax=Eremothecium cymbalariae (strain CBS 270.75 / DBVPG 7215 / KCTC 17166 / NRRL Y-17582) TaxID=931890 RepID=G8JQS6_ERECY|nr:Hypothetical protein Ecym_3595 [Eremothecium cymbalariae DBVPG\